MQEPYLYVNSRLLRRKRKKQRKILIFCSLFILTVSLIFITFPKSKPEKVIAENVATPTAVPTVNVQVADGRSLEAEVQKALEGSSGKYAVAIKNLKTGESYYLNSHEKFDTASLYKLWVALEAYRQIEDGKFTDEQTISQDVQTLNKKFRIASDSAELSEGRITRSINDALFRMITYSDNYSALILTEKLKLSSLTNFLKDNGFEDSAVGSGGADPSTTASDMATLLEKLYKKELVSPEHSDDLLDLMKQQKINGKLPKLLPEGLEIAHKTGELGSVSHDVGIVYTPNSNYIIVVLSDSNSKLGADSRIAEISKNVYSYFTKNQ